MSGNENLSDVLSVVYHALSASRRCHVIQLLANSEDGTLPVRDLAREIAAIEEEVEPEKATGEPYRNVYNALSQTHLSTLSDADIIIYDSNRQTVAAGPNLDIAALLIVLNQATYQTLRGDSLPESVDFDSTSIGD
ncbi:DUF7344 domain-containing protein [Halobacterium salinarum]|uniref:DUF7344 domain-containing protein n=1 Tax=Halobacterium salinarum TaxID=2242 RepID=UPI003D7820AD